jgi:hypothetical protein
VRTAAIPTKLLHQITADEREEFTDRFGDCWWVRKEIAVYFEKKLAELIEEAEKAEWYTLPNMMHKHADNIGERRGMRRIIKLLKEGIPDGE